MAKKFIKVLAILVSGVAFGLLLWILAFDGLEKIDGAKSFPEEPQGTYDGYFYNSLKDDEKIAYEQIMAQIESFPKKIRVPAIDDEGISDVFDALHYDNAGFFFLGDNCTIEITNFGTSYFVPEYTMSAEEYKSSKEELDRVRNMILERTQSLTDDYDKEMYAHDYIVDRCNYVDKVGGTYSSSYGCLVRGFASCEGYAKAMKYLLDAMEIENYLAYGTTEEDSDEDEGHAWNIVKINSDFYHVDVTWDDPVEAEIENRYAYFNLDDDEISKTHTADKRFLGVCTEDDENYYVKNDIVFSSYDNQTRDAIASELARQMRLGEDTVSFRMENKQALKAAEEELFDMNGIYSVMFSASAIAGRNLTQKEIMYAIDETHMIIIITDFFEQ